MVDSSGLGNLVMFAAFLAGAAFSLLLMSLNPRLLRRHQVIRPARSCVRLSPDERRDVLPGLWLKSVERSRIGVGEV